MPITVRNISVLLSDITNGDRKFIMGGSLETSYDYLSIHIVLHHLYTLFIPIQNKCTEVLCVPSNVDNVM